MKKIDYAYLTGYLEGVLMNISIISMSQDEVVAYATKMLSEYRAKMEAMKNEN